LISNGPWVRVDGVPVAWSKADLTDGVLFAPINMDESGTFHEAASLADRVWTGTMEDGTRQPDTCAAWTSGSASLSSKVGIFQSASIGWSQNNDFSCDRTTHRIYCFEDE
jgi:hypothetical protein